MDYLVPGRPIETAAAGQSWTCAVCKYCFGMRTDVLLHLLYYHFILSGLRYG